MNWNAACTGAVLRVLNLDGCLARLFFARVLSIEHGAGVDEVCLRSGYNGPIPQRWNMLHTKAVYGLGLKLTEVESSLGTSNDGISVCE